jgi:hypothetical protein
MEEGDAAIELNGGDFVFDSIGKILMVEEALESISVFFKHAEMCLL